MTTFKILFLLFPLVLWGKITPSQLYFSSNTSLADCFLERIREEKASIKLATGSFMNKKIANALVQASKKGVSVEIIVDPCSIKQRSALYSLLKGELLCIFVWKKADLAKRKKPKIKMNERFCIFGNASVWTGSFSFNKEEGSQESLLVVEDAKLAQKYGREFLRMKGQDSSSLQKYLLLHPKKKRAKKSAKEYPRGF